MRPIVRCSGLPRRFWLVALCLEKCLGALACAPAPPAGAQAASPARPPSRTERTPERATLSVAPQSTPAPEPPAQLDPDGNDEDVVTGLTLPERGGHFEKVGR